MISKVEIKNFKCFSKKQEINLAIPDDQNTGSGLTVFVGDNNSGKTAVLNAIAKLKINGFIDDDEKNKGKDVSIILTDENGYKKTIENVKGDSTIKHIEKEDEFNISFKDIYYIKDNKIWSADFGRGKTSFPAYRDNIDIERANPDGQLALVLSQIKREHPDVSKEFDSILKKIIDGFIGWSISSNRKGQFIKYQLSSDESLDINYSLGSGNLNIFKMVYGLVDPDSKIVIIDEPEAFLHPVAQMKLAQIIHEKSKNKQIIVTTHSPYLLKELLSVNSKTLIFKKNKNIFHIEDTDNKNFGLFGIGPTFGEITYLAYNLPTIEFLNELYGFTQSKNSFENSLKKFDNFLVEKNFETKKTWDHKKQSYRGLSTYIRTYIHHPEDRGTNKIYSDVELKKSIEFLIKLIRK
jgi:AAA15 family ATPase/GTPase